jgi:hypothetical protein
MQIRTLLFLALFFFGTASVSVQAQAYLSVQGTIQKSTLVSVEDAVYTLTFKLYTVETGGTPVWTEKQDSVAVIGGVYSVVLGTVNPLTAAFDQSYFLGISVGPGAELTPRARLTSAPYALSLLGQSNTFPSTGTVGVGTATPTAGYQLHVKNPNAEAKVMIDGSSKSSLVFKKGAKTQEMNYDGSKISVPGSMSIDTLTVGTLNSAGTADTVTGSILMAKHSSNARMVIDASQIRAFTSDGGPSQLLLNDYFPGTTDVGIVRIAGNFVNISRQSYGMYVEQLSNGWSALFSGSIAVQGSVGKVSDKRIKKDINYLNGAEALSTLMKLRVADYRLIDDGSSTKIHKGFIAQEVEEVLPDVVMTMTNVIPDIHAFAQGLSLSGDQLSIVLNTKHGLQVGDRVSLGADKYNKKLYTVSKTETAQSFSVSEWESALPEKLLVYGREVNDFKGVDYTQIGNLNVSATQELARRVAQLEAENAALRNHNQGLQKQNDGLRSDVNGLGSRLSKLENLLISSKGQR